MLGTSGVIKGLHGAGGGRRDVLEQEAEQHEATQCYGRHAADEVGSRERQGRIVHIDLREGRSRERHDGMSAHYLWFENMFYTMLYIYCYLFPIDFIWLFVHVHPF